MKLLFSFSFLIFISCFRFVQPEESYGQSQELYTIEGKVFPPDALLAGDLSTLGNWQVATKIVANGGEYLGFLRNDGSFMISNVPSGSYVVEAINADYAYEPARVEINSKGKFRARKVNYIQPAQVIQMPYPLKMKPYTKLRYFQIREQWRVTDFLFSPMVLMMVVPLLLIMVLPKMMNDPETRKEMEQLNSSMQYELPEVSELVLNLFSPPKPKAKAVKQSKKKQQ